MKIIGLLLAPLFLIVFVTGCASKVGPSCKDARQKGLSIPGFSREDGKSWGYPQRVGTSWCWASTAQNVMRFHKVNVEQCEIVAKVFNYASDKRCCGEKSTECWNWGGHPEMVFDKFGFSYLPARPDADRLLTWKEATEEICQERPFISSIDLTLGDRHSVVITGYSVMHGIRIYDPALDDLIYESSTDFFNDESPDYTRVRDTWDIQPKKP